MEYWDARRNMHSAIGRVKMNKVAESDLHPEHIQHECNQFVAFWRAAKRVLLLTPAPDRQAVEWKQRKLISGAEMQHENKGAGLRSRAHPADEGLEPAASSGRVFLLDPADAEAC
jgi:hypothetical protein